MTRLYVWWFDGLWRHTVCHNRTTANLLARMLGAAGHETQIIEGTTMSDGYKSATEWKQGISAALGVMPGQLNYTFDGAVEKIEDLMRDSAARKLERARAANPSLPEPDATNPMTTDDVRVDARRLLQKHSDKADLSLDAPTSLDDIRERLARCTHGCRCDDGDHENAVHDLASSDVPVLLAAFEDALAILARIQAVAADVDQDGGHSGPTLARHILNIIGGEA